MAFNLRDRHHLINYHYIEDPRADFSGIHPVPPARFEKEVGYMAEYGTIVSVPEVCAAAEAGSPDILFAITFDDGLKDQYENAVPILKKYEATATFFPITKTFDGKLPQTHKIHLLLSRFSANELIDRLNDWFSKRDDTRSFLIPKDRRVTDKRKLRDDVLTANFKETLNLVGAKLEEELLAFLFDALKLDEKALARQLFMTPDQIRELDALGYTIGSHTHNHYALDLQPREVVETEVTTANKRLSPLVQKPLTIFSYPHGGTNKMVQEVIARNGFQYAFTIERSAVRPTDHPLLLPRHDTNDLREFIEKK